MGASGPWSCREHGAGAWAETRQLEPPAETGWWWRWKVSRFVRGGPYQRGWNDMTAALVRAWMLVCARQAWHRYSILVRAPFLTAQSLTPSRLLMLMSVTKLITTVIPQNGSKATSGYTEQTD